MAILVALGEPMACRPAGRPAAGAQPAGGDHSVDVGPKLLEHGLYLVVALALGIHP